MLSQSDAIACYLASFVQNHTYHGHVKIDLHIFTERLLSSENVFVIKASQKHNYEDGHIVFVSRKAVPDKEKFVKVRIRSIMKKWANGAVATPTEDDDSLLINLDHVFMRKFIAQSLTNYSFTDYNKGNDVSYFVDTVGTNSDANEKINNADGDSDNTEDDSHNTDDDSDDSEDTENDSDATEEGQLKEENIMSADLMQFYALEAEKQKSKDLELQICEHESLTRERAHEIRGLHRNLQKDTEHYIELGKEKDALTLKIYEIKLYLRQCPNSEVAHNDMFIRIEEKRKLQRKMTSLSYYIKRTNYAIAETLRQMCL